MSSILKTTNPSNLARESIPLNEELKNSSYFSLKRGFNSSPPENIKKNMSHPFEQLMLELNHCVLCSRLLRCFFFRQEPANCGNPDKDNIEGQFPHCRMGKFIWNNPNVWVCQC